MDAMDYNSPESYFEYVAEVSQSVNAAEIKKRAFRAMDELDGWCDKQKAGILIDFVLAMKPDTIVEIGVYGGKSLVPMAIAQQATGKGIVYGIDPWDSLESIKGMDDINREWWQRLDHGAILRGLMMKIKQFGLQDQISLIKSTSKDAAPIYDIDILHIDGNHSEETSYVDVTKWVPLVKSGGIIVLDDVTWFNVQTGQTTQTKSVQWLNKHCIKQAQYHDICDWAIWIKK